MFDIRKIAIGLTADMPVRDVDGEIVKGDDGQPLTITLFSPGSKEHAKAKVRFQNDVKDEMEKEEEEKANKNKKGYQKPAVNEDIPDRATIRAAQFWADVTASLNGFDYPGGPKALYLDQTLGHIGEDVDKFVMKRGNFKQSSASGSLNTSDTQPG